MLKENNVCLDAPTIPLEQESVVNKSSSRKTTDSNFVEGSSTDISFEDNRTDEFVDLLCDDDIELENDEDAIKIDADEDNNDTAEQTKIEQKDDTTLSNKEDELEFVDDDGEVEREFDEYLNDESRDDWDEMKRDKLLRLEALDCSFENYELLQKMAIERHGLLNKRCRRRIWPLLILYRPRFLKASSSNHTETMESADNQTIQDMIDSSLTKFDDIGLSIRFLHLFFIVSQFKKLFYLFIF